MDSEKRLAARQRQCINQWGDWVYATMDCFNIAAECSTYVIQNVQFWLSLELKKLDPSTAQQGVHWIECWTNAGEPLALLPAQWLQSAPVKQVSHRVRLTWISSSELLKPKRTVQICLNQWNHITKVWPNHAKPYFYITCSFLISSWILITSLRNLNPSFSATVLGQIARALIQLQLLTGWHINQGMKYSLIIALSFQIYPRNVITFSWESIPPESSSNPLVTRPSEKGMWLRGTFSDWSTHSHNSGKT